MTTTFKGMGGSKYPLFADITAAYAGREFTYDEVSKLPSFEHRVFIRLYHAGLLHYSKRGNKGTWRVTSYTQWGHGQSSSGSVTA
jgi:carboxypeptidase C (cathepsin A)